MAKLNSIFHDFSKDLIGKKDITFNVEGGALRYLFVCYGEKEIEKNIVINLDKEGAVARVCGVILGKGSGIYHINITVNHVAAYTETKTTLKAVLYDKARLAFLGKVRVGAGAQKSKASLSQNTLLMGEACYVESAPQLEVEANDVVCEHNVIMKRPEGQQIFYLMSRGVSRKAALDLIVSGFLKEKCLM